MEYNLPAPVTTGKLCTSLDQMQIGDFIKCAYDAPIENVAGYFSQLGKVNPTYTLTTIDENGKKTTEEVAYEELPTDVPAKSNVSGFFYLLKVDKGTLVADRMVQSYISWEAINKKNYVYGGIFNAAEAKVNKTVTKSVTTKTKEDNDVASDNTENDEQFTKDECNMTTTHTVVALDSENNTTTTTVTTTKTEYVNQSINQSIAIRLLDSSEYINYINNDDLKGNITKNSINVWHHGSDPTPIGSSNHYCTVTQKTTNNAAYGFTGASYVDQPYNKTLVETYFDYWRGPVHYYYRSFRPVFSYIDNLNSTTQFY